MSLRIRVLTSLYPSAETPFEGIFAARKWQGMVERGHDVEVIVPLPWAPRAFAAWLPEHHARLARTPGEEVRDSVRVTRPRYLHVPSRSLGNARRFASVGVRAIASGGATAPDVVVCDYAWPAAAAAPALVARGLPVVVNGRGSDVLQVMAIDGLSGALAAGLGAAHGLTAVSQDLLDAMVELSGGGGCAALTPNGVDSERFCPGPRAAAREALAQPTDGTLVLVVGHLIERKDPCLSLEAFHAAGLAGARLVFVGRGPLLASVAKRAEELGIDAQVALLGERPPEELRDWYRAADVLLLTSSREGRPNVVLEALSSGCPVLATDAGGTAELIPSERMLARTRDPKAIGAMLSALTESPPEAAELASATRALTWDASLDALEGVLAEAIRRAAASSR